MGKLVVIYVITVITAFKWVQFTLTFSEQVNDEQVCLVGMMFDKTEGQGKGLISRAVYTLTELQTIKLHQHMGKRKRVEVAH